MLTHHDPVLTRRRGPIFTNDELRIFRRPLDTWRKKNVVTGRTEVINNTYYVWLNAEEGRIGSLPGWKSSQQPQNFTLRELGLGTGRISHSFPIANDLSVQPLPSSKSHSSTRGCKLLHSALPVTPTLHGERWVSWTVLKRVSEISMHMIVVARMDMNI